MSPKLGLSSPQFDNRMLRSDVGMSEFTFRSPSVGTLEYIVFYLYDRTDQTPKDEIKGDQRGHSAFLVAIFVGDCFFTVMARTARASVGGICYHVMNHGNERPEKGLKKQNVPFNFPLTSIHVKLRIRESDVNSQHN